MEWVLVAVYIVVGYLVSGAYYYVDQKRRLKGGLGVLFDFKLIWTLWPLFVVFALVVPLDWLKERLNRLITYDRLYRPFLPKEVKDNREWKQQY